MDYDAEKRELQILNKKSVETQTENNEKIDDFEEKSKNSEIENSVLTEKTDMKKDIDTINKL